MNRWKDWYEQGIRDMERAELDKKFGFYEWACFTSQQAAEKVIKGVGMKLGINLWGHSLTEMLALLSSEIKIPKDIEEKAKLLDLYYIPPRYPADYFTERQAEEAINAANSIIRFCEKHIFG